MDEPQLRLQASDVTAGQVGMTEQSAAAGRTEEHAVAVDQMGSEKDAPPAALALLAKHAYRSVGFLGKGQYGLVLDVNNGLAAKLPLTSTSHRMIQNEYDALQRLYDLCPAGVVQPVGLLPDCSYTTIIMSKAGKSVHTMKDDIDEPLGIYLLQMARSFAAAKMVYLDMHFANILWDASTGFRLCDVDPAFILQTNELHSEAMSLYFALHRSLQRPKAAAVIARRLDELLCASGLSLHALVTEFRKHVLFRTFQSHLRVRISPLKKLLLHSHSYDLRKTAPAC